MSVKLPLDIQLAKMLSETLSKFAESMGTLAEGGEAALPSALPEGEGVSIAETTLETLKQVLADVGETPQIAPEFVPDHCALESGRDKSAFENLLHDGRKSEGPLKDAELLSQLEEVQKQPVLRPSAQVHNAAIIAPAPLFPAVEARHEAQFEGASYQEESGQGQSGGEQEEGESGEENDAVEKELVKLIHHKKITTLI